MLQLNTGQARTDLYEVGKGSDQVFDPTIGVHIADREMAANERKRAAKAKQEQENLDDINAQLKGMQGKAIMSHDTPLVAEKSQAIIDYTRKNIDKLKSGDINTKLGFDQIMADLQQTTAQSVDKRQKVEQTAQMLAANPDKYRPDSITSLGGFISSKHAGDMNFNPAEYVKENINYNERVVKELSPFAQRMAQDKPLSKTFTKEQANELIASDLEDPHNFEQAHYDFEKASDKLGAKDPIEYYQKRYADKLIVKDVKAPQEWMVSGESEKNKINVTHTTDKEGGELHVMNKNTNEEVTIQHDKNGNVIGGISKIKLTPEEKTQNDKVLANNIAKQNQYNKDLKKAKEALAKLGTPENNEEAQANFDAVSELIPKKDADEYKQEPLPYQEKDEKLDKQGALEVAHDKFGIKPSEIIQGKTPANVDIQRVQKKNVIKAGDNVGGYIFLGGDPNNPKSWKKQ
jgi:hypothetical protein